MKHEQKTVRNLNLTFKINMPLPVDIGKVVVWGGRPNSVCRLSFCHSHVGTVTIYMKNIMQHGYAKFVKM
jgi:hypothetical protein